ncbi:hypothetical protein G6F42_020880 [Rhizopus arrhizus]|nr:hypothetical protein G6F42_020880 [Rhizopus arrhizus]
MRTASQRKLTVYKGESANVYLPFRCPEVSEDTRPPPSSAHPAGPAHPSADVRAQARTHNPAHAPTSAPTPNPSTMKPELLQAAVAKLNEQNYLSQSQSQSQGDTQQESSYAHATAYASTSAALVTVTGFLLLLPILHLLRFKLEFFASTASDILNNAPFHDIAIQVNGALMKPRGYLLLSNTEHPGVCLLKQKSPNYDHPILLSYGAFISAY